MKLIIALWIDLSGSTCKFILEFFIWLYVYCTLTPSLNTCNILLTPSLIIELNKIFHMLILYLYKGHDYTIF